MNPFEFLAAKHEPELWARDRLVPAQPTDTPPEKLFVGSDIGYIDYMGVKPQPGDLVAIVGQHGQRAAFLQSPLHAMHTPTFSGGCLCRCPASGGIAFYMQSSCRNSVILALDATTGAVLQVFGLGDLWYGRGIAVDNNTPFNLYVLDDRRILHKPILTTALTPTRGYFTVVTFSISSGQYHATTYTDMADPLPPPASPAGFPGIGIETQDQDPPGFTRQSLSIIQGVLHLTMYKAPARFLTMSGGVFTTVSLTSGGSPVNLGLRGQIVTISDQPANKLNRYCIATDGTNYFVLQFNEAGVVTAQLSIDAEPQPAQLATVCNQMLILSTDTTTLVPSTENSP